MRPRRTDGNLLVSRVLVQGGQTLRVDFQYDLAGNVVFESRSSDAAGTVVVATTAFGSDAAGRLTSEVQAAVDGTVLASTATSTIRRVG